MAFICLLLILLGAFSAWSHPTLLLHQVGESSVLPCSCRGGDFAMCYWYKQAAGLKPVNITSYDIFKDKAKIHFEELDDNLRASQRFSLNNTNKENNLKIEDLQVADAAVYFCIGSHLYDLKFLKEITLDVTDARIEDTRLVFDWTPENSGAKKDSEKLDCTLSDGKGEMFWFNPLKESSKGVLYRRGGSRNRSEGEMDTFGNCVYNLPEHSDNTSNDWRKCAVASCGKLLYATKYQPEDGESRSVVVYVLGGALAVTLIVSLFLALAIYKIKKKCESQSSASLEKEEDVHYAALKQRTSNRPRTAAGGTNTECVYSGVRL